MPGPAHSGIPGWAMLALPQGCHRAGSADRRVPSRDHRLAPAP